MCRVARVVDKVDIVVVAKGVGGEELGGGGNGDHKIYRGYVYSAFQVVRFYGVLEGFVNKTTGLCDSKKT